jgi:uncharacterized membrane protein HdeD (DUF308 family)
MIETLIRNWGWIALRGVIAILFGILTLFYPSISLASFVILFGAFAFADGFVTTISAATNRRGQPRWVALFFSGLLGIGTGLVTFFWPGITAVALLTVIAVWAILLGCAEIAVAVRLRKLIEGEWLLVLAGLLTLAFGVVLALEPAAGALTMAIYIAVYAITWGIMLIALAFRLRSWARAHPLPSAA